LKFTIFLPVPGEDEEALRVQLVPLFLLKYQHLEQLANQRNRSPFVILRLAWLQPHDARGEIDLRPQQRKNLRLPTTSRVRERDHRAKMLGQLGPQQGKVFVIEEALAHVVFGELRNFGTAATIGGSA
jgi:hypothetical protein